MAKKKTYKDGWNAALKRVLKMFKEDQDGDWDFIRWQVQELAARTCAAEKETK